MKSITMKFAFICFVLFSVGNLFATPQKLGFIKSINGNAPISIAYHNGYCLFLCPQGKIKVYSVDGDNYTLLKVKNFNFSYDSGDGVPPVFYQNYMYVRTIKDKLLIFDVSGLPDIEFVKSYQLDGDFNYPKGLAIKDNMLFIGGYSKNSVLVLSIEDPVNPYEITTLEAPHESDMGIHFILPVNNLLITVPAYRDGNVTIWDISDINNPQILKQYNFDNLRYGLLIDDDYVLINADYKIYLIDISDPSNLPSEPVETNLTGAIQYAKTLNENIFYVYHANYNFINKNELQHPDSISPVERNLDYDYSLSTIPACVQDGENNYKLYASFSSSYKGILNVNDETQEVSLINDFDKSEFSYPGGIARSSEYLYTNHGQEGMSIYRLNDNYMPQFVKTFNYNSELNPINFFKIIEDSNSKVSQTYLVAVTYKKIFIFDLDDPENPSYVSDIDTGETIYNIYISGNYIYSLHYKKLRIINISDLTNPQIVSTTDLGTHIYSGMYLYNNYLYLGKYIFDVSDKTSPVIITDSFEAIFLTGYENYLVTVNNNWYSKELHLYDLTDPESPQDIQTLEVAYTTRGTQNRYMYTKNNFIVFTNYTSSTYLPQTTFLKIVDGKLEINYIADSTIKDFEQSEKYFYSVDGVKQTFDILGLTHFIPHIANTWGWETHLIVDNTSPHTEQFWYTVKDEVNIGHYRQDIGGNRQKAIKLTKGQTAEIITPLDTYLLFKVSYHHTGENGIAEFSLDTHTGKDFNLVMPQYLSDHLTWMGLATSNSGSEYSGQHFYTFDQSGNSIGTYSYSAFPMTRFASVLDHIFSNPDNISRIKVNSNFYSNGLTISGNGNSQLLFTPAVYQGEKYDTRYIPHIDVNGYWNTYLVFDNPTDSDITVTMTLYSEGNTVVQENKTIPANSNLTVLLNDYADQNVDCGELTNCGEDLIVRLAYMFQSTGATAEFLINGDELGSWLNFDLPAYRADTLTWWGIALMNPYDVAVSVTLTAYSNGEAIDSATITLNGHSKIAKLLEDIFTNLNGRTVERVVGQSDVALILGLNISGSNQDRYLFTKAIPD